MIFRVTLPLPSDTQLKCVQLWLVENTALMLERGEFLLTDLFNSALLLERGASEISITIVRHRLPLIHLAYFNETSICQLCDNISS